MRRSTPTTEPQPDRAEACRMTHAATALGTFFERINRWAGLLVARWRRTTAPNRYQPEKYYMRGPGPKNSGKVGKSDQSSGAA